MYKKVWCTCEVVVLLIKPIAFFAFSLPSASLDLGTVGGFTRFTAKYCLKTSQEQQEDTDEKHLPFGVYLQSET